MKMTRREIIKKVILGTTSLVVIPKVITACSEKEPLFIEDLSETLTIDLTDPTYAPLTVTGGYMIVQGKLIANTGSNVFIAAEAICSHQGGTLEYDHSQNVFKCPVHGSSFSPAGVVIERPALNMIKTYSAVKFGESLTILLKS